MRWARWLRSINFPLLQINSQLSALNNELRVDIKISMDSTRELIIDYGQGDSTVDIKQEDTLADVRRLIIDDFDDDMIPAEDWVFWVNGLRITQKQEGRKIAWNYLPAEGTASQKDTIQIRSKKDGNPKRQRQVLSDEMAGEGSFLAKGEVKVEAGDDPESKRRRIESTTSVLITPSI